MQDEVLELGERFRVQVEVECLWYMPRNWS